MARGPWDPERVQASWRADPFQPTADVTAAADDALDALRRRGSPSHDGLAARLSGFQAKPDRLALELEPVRWSVRLVAENAAQSLSALTVVRADGVMSQAGFRGSRKSLGVLGQRYWGSFQPARKGCATAAAVAIRLPDELGA